jgi:hypothetical protein
METREAITLDTRAQQRLMVLTHVAAGELDRDTAAAILGLSLRQVRGCSIDIGQREQRRSSTATAAAVRPTGSTR